MCGPPLATGAHLFIGNNPELTPKKAIVNDSYALGQVSRVCPDHRCVRPKIGFPPGRSLYGLSVTARQCGRRVRPTDQAVSSRSPAGTRPASCVRRRSPHASRLEMQRIESVVLVARQLHAVFFPTL